MHRSLIGLAAAATIGVAALAVPSAANARCFDCAVGAGVLGGVIAGAVVGGAIANSPPPPGYYPPPPPPPAAYYPPPPAYAELGPGCYWGRRQVWIEGAGYRWRTVPICP
jgi:hypothetical protein